LDSYKL